MRLINIKNDDSLSKTGELFQGSLENSQGLYPRLFASSLGNCLFIGKITAVLLHYCLFAKLSAIVLNAFI